MVAASVLRQWLADPAVNYAVTRPGAFGAGVAFAAELLISLGFMIAVLVLSNVARLAPLTGIAAGALIAIYITIEAPLSGMSINPARTLASAVPAAFWMALWVYFTAPVLGMFLAAEGYLHDSVYVTTRGQVVLGVDDLAGAVQVAGGMAVMTFE